MKFLLVSFFLLAGPPLQQDDFVLTTADISPFSFVESGTEVGINHDLVNEIAKRSGLKFKMKRESKSKTLTDLRNGTGHYTFGYKNKDFETFLDTPICFLSSPVVA